MKRKNEQGRACSVWLLPVLCGAGSLVLAAALTLTGGTAGKAVHALSREGYGGDVKTYELLVEGLEAEPVPVSVEVGPRMYTKEEAEACFYAMMDGIEDMIRGENPSLMEVEKDLILPTEEKGIQFRWHSSEPESLSSQGKVRMEGEEPVDAVLYAALSAGAYQADFEVPVRLVPPQLCEEEQRLRRLQETIRQEDEAQKEEEALSLPGEQDGKRLSYREAETADYRAVPLLGLALAGLLIVREREQEREKEKKREQELLLDHAELVSKLMVFIGAGMTVRSAWERTVKDYEAGLAHGRLKPRAAYEEMRQTYYQLVNGMPEGAAYREFGRRCRLQPYLKLSSLLEQNRKAGAKNLRSILRTEMEDAFELRKNLARRMGEEAGTKLLLPLFLMLGIVMVMIMVPAMMTMG